MNAHADNTAPKQREQKRSPAHAPRSLRGESKSERERQASYAERTRDEPPRMLAEEEDC